MVVTLVVFNALLENQLVVSVDKEMKRPTSIQKIKGKCVLMINMFGKSGFKKVYCSWEHIGMRPTLSFLGNVCV